MRKANSGSFNSKGEYLSQSGEEIPGIETNKEQIVKWRDVIFGEYQFGNLASEKFNVFLPYAYNYWGFKKSDDIRTVDAEVIYSSVHSRENEYGTKEYYRRLKVKYEIDGKVYTGNTETKSQLNKGDLCNIKVYKTTEGDYKIPEYTSDTAYKLWSALYIGTVALGVIFLIISITGFVPEKE